MFTFAIVVIMKIATSILILSKYPSRLKVMSIDYTHRLVFVLQKFSPDLEFETPILNLPWHCSLTGEQRCKKVKELPVCALNIWELGITDFDKR